MSFAPYAALPQGFTWAPAPHSGMSGISGQAQMPTNIIIRPTQPDGTQGPPQMFLQSPPSQQMTPQPQQGMTAVPAVQQINKPRQALEMGNIQPKMQPRGVHNIMPHRPASSVSTQTIQNASPTQVIIRAT